MVKKEEVGRRIKQVREHAGLSQSDFGQRIGVHRQTVYRLESGRLKLSSKKRDTICEEFGVDPAWLEFGRGDMFGDLQDVAEGSLADRAESLAAQLTTLARELRERE